MKKAKILENCEFIVMLRTSLNRQFTHQEQVLLDGAYDRFLARVERISQGPMSKLEKLRLFTRTGETLERLRLNLRDQTSSRCLYTQSAISILNFEKRAILLQLHYPSLVDNGGCVAPKSPLYWSKQFTATDLMELMTALQLTGAVRRMDGTQIDWETLVGVLSRVFNIRINNPAQCRHAVVNRKWRLTRFLDLLRNYLVESSRQ